MPEKSQHLIVSSMHSNILVLTITNPPNNLMPPAFFNELDHHYQHMISPEVRAVIFTGEGHVFSKGADLAAIDADGTASSEERFVFANDLINAISRLDKPVIAAINGACLGGGFELALACHLRLSIPKARLGLPETSIGLVPGLGGLQRLIRLAGEAKALEMVLLGDMFSAERALDWNLINRILPKETFFERVHLFTKTILAGSREAIAAVLELAAGLREQTDTRQALETARRFTKLVRNRMK
ncbi:enoyl-CoA hydratase/isomerase family protein [Desulfatiglans anilini]|uniref:enoyl-CoA hydratase/isomerase family protein n=1 Tax=Desulfatiglans anilini TaxID=90728 RepID=UPI00041DE4DD|nr:enoyl-CoA hydratase/isomerase family protein [Desulfatiglans anilini]